MAIDFDLLRLLVLAKRDQVDFSSTLTLGRQGVNLEEKHLEYVQKKMAFSIDRSVLGNDYAENLIRCLGAQTVDSLDYSDYEGATCIHDLNSPVGADLCGKYSVIIDGGTLEHVFNLPVALSNCMRMLKVGGCFIGASPSNNFLGHGFYQFSPELFFRVFSKENGFELKVVYLSEQYPDKLGDIWYEAKDPEVLRQRGVLRNYAETAILFIARKNEEVLPFRQTPQQSDYSRLWTAGKGHHGKRVSRLWSGVAGAMKCKLIFALTRFLSNRKFKAPYFTPFRF